MTWLGPLELTQPWMLLLALLAVPVFVWARRGPGRVAFSSLAILPEGSRGWRARLAWVPDVLLALSVLTLAVAVAGPRIADRSTKVNREGIAIMMVLDTSGSMRALDLSPPGGRNHAPRCREERVHRLREPGGARCPGGPTTRSAS